MLKIKTRPYPPLLSVNEFPFVPLPPQSFLPFLHGCLCPARHHSSPCSTWRQSDSSVRAKGGPSLPADPQHGWCPAGGRDGGPTHTQPPQCSLWFGSSEHTPCQHRASPAGSMSPAQMGAAWLQRGAAEIATTSGQAMRGLCSTGWLA